MSWTPQLKLYDSTGATLLYTFPLLQYANIPQSVTDYVEISNTKSANAIIIDGGNKPWDINIRFVLQGNDYEDTTSKIISLENTVALKVAYKLRFDKTSTTYFEYNIKRLEPFIYIEGRRIKFQKVEGVFRANAW